MNEQNGTFYQNIFKKFGWRKLFPIARNSAFRCASIIFGGGKRSADNGDKVCFFAFFYRHGATIQTGVIPIINRCVSFACHLKSLTAKPVDSGANCSDEYKRRHIELLFDSRIAVEFSSTTTTATPFLSANSSCVSFHRYFFGCLLAFI